MIKKIAKMIAQMCEVNNSMVVINGSGLIKGNGVREVTDRDVDDFNSIELNGGVDVVYKPSDEPYAKVTCDSNIQDLIKLTVVGKKLIIKAKGSFRVKNRVIVECGCKNLESALVNGSGDVDLGKFSGRSLGLHIRGSGSIKVAGEFDDVTARVDSSGDIVLDYVRAESFDLIVNGSGDIVACGMCAVVTAEVEGSGDINCRQLNATDAYLSIKGSGDINARCKDKLTATVKGSGDICVKGSPQRVNQKVRGSGDIEIC